MVKETRRTVVKLEVEKKTGVVCGQVCSEYEAARGYIFVSVIKEADYEIRLDWRTNSPVAYELNGTCHYFYMDGGTEVELIHTEFGWRLQQEYLKAAIRNAK
jgi:hypothetical protein